MQIGIIGLPQVGKKSLFQLLTGGNVAAAKGKSAKGGAVGIAKVRDPRFDKLVGMYKPKKSVPAAIEFVVLPKIEKESIASGEAFGAVADVDAICHVVRAFADEAVFHVDGAVDPMRDIETVNAELILNDLIFVEKRLERLAKEMVRNSDKTKEKEKGYLLGFKECLDAGKFLKTVEFDEEMRKMFASYPFLTRKNIVVALNIGEDKIGDESLLKAVSEKFGPIGIKAIQVSAKVEGEISQLDNDEERVAFLKDLGITEPAIDKLSRVCCETLGLIYFFTVGEDEVRAWTIKKGSLAPLAGRAIHSDIERGFIRAEVMRYDELVAVGTEQKLKEAGKLYLKGKDYVVEDGDIINFRFSV
ncbi:MAG TPA: redox-regulated ATPase YchF [bacterium]|nr:redox-regulated ATPase YchF [bacterium]